MKALKKRIVIQSKFLKKSILSKKQISSLEFNVKYNIHILHLSTEFCLIKNMSIK